MSTSKHHIERLTGLLKDRVVREEGEEWGATEMGGSVVFTLFGKRGVWSCGPDGCDGKGFLLSVQGYSKRRPLPASYKDALEEDKKNPSPPKAWIRLTPAPDNSTDVDFYADKEYQSLFESLVSELVDPVQGLSTGTDEKTSSAPQPRVPGRGKDRRRWVATWRAIRPQVERGKAYNEIATWLRKTHPADLACSADILADIIRAGEAGLLDGQNSQ